MTKQSPPSSHTQNSQLLLLLVVLLATSRQAHAYADPGSGALIWQMLVAGFLGLAFYFRRLVNWLRTKFRGAQD